MQQPGDIAREGGARIEDEDSRRGRIKEVRRENMALCDSTVWYLRSVHIVLCNSYLIMEDSLIPLDTLVTRWQLQLLKVIAHPVPNHQA